MDTLLIVITALSLAMATALAIIVLKLVGDEQRRSLARVTMLAELAAVSSASETDIAPPAVRASTSIPERAHDRRPAPIPLAPIEIDDQDDEDLELRPSETAVAGVADLFAAPETASPAGRRFGVAAALAVVVFGAGFVLVSMQPREADTAAIQPAAAAVPAAAPSLELLSLRHTQQDTSLTVTGLVQNPRGAAPVSRAAATVFLFGADGAFLASGRAPLDFTTLAPGDESPFVVTVPVTGQVARYRVGFRSEDGAVIAHVDKRGPDALASRAGSQP